MQVKDLLRFRGRRIDLGIHDQSRDLSVSYVGRFHDISDDGARVVLTDVEECFWPDEDSEEPVRSFHERVAIPIASIEALEAVDQKEP